MDAPAAPVPGWRLPRCLTIASDICSIQTSQSWMSQEILKPLYPGNGPGEITPVERGIGFERIPQFLCSDPERVVLEDCIRVVHEGFIPVDGLQASPNPAGSDGRIPAYRSRFLRFPVSGGGAHAARSDGSTCECSSSSSTAITCFWKVPRCFWSRARRAPRGSPACNVFSVDFTGVSCGAGPACDLRYFFKNAIWTSVSRAAPSARVIFFISRSQNRYSFPGSSWQKGEVPHGAGGRLPACGGHARYHRPPVPGNFGREYSR